MSDKNQTYFIYNRIKDMPLIGGYTDEGLARCTFNLLEGIFSQQVPDQEYELVEPLFLEYFSVIQNVENASERLALFKVYLQYILALLMDTPRKNKNDRQYQYEKQLICDRYFHYIKQSDPLMFWSSFLHLARAGQGILSDFERMVYFMKYNIKMAKQAVLSDAIAAYYQIWQTDGIDTSLEEELILNAVFKILDENTGSRKQFEELLGISYMFQGIRDRLEQRCKVRGAENGPEEDIPEGNRTYGDEEIPF